MIRYISIYFSFLTFSISKAFEFRLDFFFRIFMDVMYYAVNIGFYHLIYRHTSLLGGWSEDQLLIFVGIYLTVDAMVMTIFANNLWWLPIFVNKGDVDYYLTRPISSMFFLSLRQFAADSFVNLLCALGLLVFFISKSSVILGLGNISLLILTLLNGAVLYYLIQLSFILPVFWFHSADGMLGVFYNTTRFMERPHRIYKGVMRVLLTSFLPFCVVASFPAQLFLEGFNYQIFALTFGITAVYFVAVRVFWKVAVRNYSSASS